MSLWFKDSKLANHEHFDLLLSWENTSTEDLHLDDCRTMFSTHSRVKALVTVRFQPADVFTDKAMEKSRYSFTCCLNGRELEDLSLAANLGYAHSRTVHLQLLVIRHMPFRHSPLLNSYIPQWFANFLFAGVVYAVWDNFWGIPTVTFHIEKKVRILPQQDLNELMQGTGSSNLPSQVASVEEWRARALESIARLPVHFVTGAVCRGCRGRCDAASPSSSTGTAESGPAAVLSACLDEVKLSQNSASLAETCSASAAGKHPESPRCRQPGSEVLPGVMPVEVVPSRGSRSQPLTVQVDDKALATILGTPASSSRESSPTPTTSDAAAELHQRHVFGNIPVVRKNLYTFEQRT